MCCRRFCTGIISTPWLPLFFSTLCKAKSIFSRDRIRFKSIVILPSVNSWSSYASAHSTLQEDPCGIHRFLPQVRYYVFCVQHDALNAKGYSLLIVRSFRIVLDQAVLLPLLTSDGSATYR